MEHTERLLKAKEAKKITGYSNGKLYGMIASGELPSIRRGRCIRVPERALLAWIKANTTGGDTPAAA